MRTRSQARLKALKWTSLPAEIRLMILSAIAHQKNTGWASFASVCTEWQHALEKANFYKLKLGVSCLEDFKSLISPRKRDIIHHICLNVELQRYMYKCCSDLWSPPERILLRRRSPPPDKISSIVSGERWRLLSVLSKWKPAAHLALEINVYSPSDCEHYFKNLFLSTDDLNLPPWCSEIQLFQPIFLVFDETLPRVPAVTCLIIRRQLRRCIEEEGLGMILHSLEGLEHISYEPWADYIPAFRGYHDRNTVKKLTIFEDAYENYELFSDPPVPGPWIDWNDPSKRLDAVLASKSLDLQHFAISFKIEGLLCQASALAQKMPKLHTFVLWNGGKGHACAFIYRIGRDYTTIVWRGTWRLELSPRVVESWQFVASKLCDEKFQVRQEFLKGGMKWHGDAIYHLDLPCQVVDPASLWQIRREAWSLEG
ncbi:hypothetical protein LZ31DRAFT_609542 [Colletotrichum somersetense]|nr:hypothetical protein LZ31DRAFT_609542 [Colletotrichum somersetense]